MNIHDYLIQQPELDWHLLLREWTPPLPEIFNLWLVNKLGEVIVVTENNSVHWLDLQTGEVEQIASSREEFAQLLDQPGNADRWLRISVVDTCRKAGMTLGEFQCYGIKIPPSLGGSYDLANIMPKDLITHYSFMAHMHKQTDVYWVPEDMS
jgi:hypothetical protein